MATLGTVEPFDPESDDWPTYSERLEQFFLANRITDYAGKRVAAFLTVIGPKAYTLLRNVLAPDKPATKTYAELVAALKAHLDPKPLVIAERFKFHRRSQKEGETVAQYLAELRKLAEYCDFKDHREEALRDRLVCGIQSKAIQKRLLAEADLTLQKAYEVAQGIEAARKQASQLRASSRTQEVHSIASGDTKPCYRCSRTGHAHDKCYFKTQKCRNCGKQGHIAKVCKGPRKRQQAAPKKGNHRTRYVEQEGILQSHIDSDAWGMFAIKAIQDEPDAGIHIEVKVNGIPIHMELDTGASVTIISERTWQAKMAAVPLQKSGILLKTYTGERPKVLGEAQVQVTYNTQRAQLPIVVVEGNEWPFLVWEKLALSHPAKTFLYRARGPLAEVQCPVQG